MKNLKNKLLIASCAVGNIGTFAFAAGETSDVMNNIIKTIGRYAQYLGMGLLAWGVIQFLLAMRNEDSESKAKALPSMIAGAVLLGAPAVLNMIIGGKGDIGTISSVTDF